MGMKLTPNTSTTETRSIIELPSRTVDETTPFLTYGTPNGDYTNKDSKRTLLVITTSGSGDYSYLKYGIVPPNSSRSLYWSRTGDAIFIMI